MADETTTRTIEIPKEGPLAFTFVLHYKDGSYDHARIGRILEKARLADGTELRRHALEDCGIPGIACSHESERGGRFETSTVQLDIDATAPLPMEIVVTEVDEYHPDYWNQQGLAWEERQPRISNRTEVWRVVAAGQV